MATQNDFSRSYSVNAAMSAFVRVAVSSNGRIGPAGLGVVGVGMLQEDTTAGTYENPKVRFYGTGSARAAVTGCPITASAVLFCLANGLAGPAGGTVSYGYALENAATNGQVIEVVTLC